MRWLALAAGMLSAQGLRADDFSALPGWREDRVAEAVSLFRSSCPRLDAAFRAACAEIRRVPAGDEDAARAFVAWAFRPVRLGDARVTSYFELEVAGSRTRGGAYQWPLLRPPAQPTRYARADILAGALGGRGLELVWLASAADLYFVQLQGSARIMLAEGGSLRIGGARQNGFTSIPTADLFGGAGIPGNDLSVPGIRAWAAAHPRQAEDRLAREQSYFFFDERRGAAESGPVGSLGVSLAPLRSVAVDPHAVRMGSLMWLDTRISAHGQALRRMVLAHDTGEPVRGAAHIDLFFGSGPQAEAIGGRQNATGAVWVLEAR